jgi:hypothetical protein
MLRVIPEQFTVAEAMCDPVSLNDPFRNSREENKIRFGNEIFSLFRGETRGGGVIERRNQGRRRDVNLICIFSK